MKTVVLYICKGAYKRSLDGLYKSSEFFFLQVRQRKTITSVSSKFLPYCGRAD